MDESKVDAVQEVLRRIIQDAGARDSYVIDGYDEVLVAADHTAAAEGRNGIGLIGTESLARLSGEKELSIIFDDGAEPNIHVSEIKPGLALVIVFDEKASLRAVRAAAKEHRSPLAAVFKHRRKSSGSPPDPDDSDPRSGAAAHVEPSR